MLFPAILYECKNCGMNQLITEGDHKNAWLWFECDQCGEAMTPANKEDLETMDIYDEHDV